MAIKHTRSSTRHRISRRRTRHVVETTNVIFTEDAPAGSALTDDGGLLVIHAQPIRAGYLKLLTGGLK